MRIVQAYGALPDYYDRGASNQTIEYQGNSISPHSSTLRATYTVPDGRKAIVDSVFMLITRGEVATAFGRTRMTVFYTPSGGSPIPIACVQNEANSYNYTVHQTFTGLGVLQAGDTLDIYTLDESTGGKCHYWACAKIYEFE